MTLRTDPIKHAGQVVWDICTRWPEKSGDALPCTPNIKDECTVLSDRENLPSVARRITAGQMLLDGASPDDVANKLNLSKATVKRYKSLVELGGLEALAQLSLGGRPSVLDREALTWLSKALQGSAKVHGFESDTWTNARLRALIEARFGVRYSRVYTWQIAKNLGLGHLLSKSRR